MTQTQAPQSSQVSQPSEATPAEVRQASMMLKFYQLAERMIQDYTYEIGRHQPMNDRMLGPDVYKLAVETTLRPLIMQKDLLHVFCEPAAADLLLRLPNRYWFWMTIKSAILNVEDDGLNMPLKQEHVALALAEIRRGYTSKYNLRTPVAELSPAQIASRAVAGVILVRACFGELDEIVVNPIFAPCPGTDGTFAQSAAALTAALLKG